MESRVRCFLYGCLVVEYQISGYPLWRRSFLAMSRPSYSVRYLCTAKASKKISWCFSLSESPSFDQFHKNRPIKSKEGPSFGINSAKYIDRSSLIWIEQAAGNKNMNRNCFRLCWISLFLDPFVWLQTMTSVTNNGQFSSDEFVSNKETFAILLSVILEKSFRLGHFRHYRSKKFLLKTAIFLLLVTVAYYRLFTCLVSFSVQ